MSTIMKTGKVEIAEDRILVTEFTFDGLDYAVDLAGAGDSTPLAQKEALLWAREKINESLEELKETPKEAQTKERNTDELKYYKLEQCAVPGYRMDVMSEWRYYSLYSGARGVWHASKDVAIAEGEAHKALIIALHVRGKITSVQNLRRLGA